MSGYVERFAPKGILDGLAVSVLTRLTIQCETSSPVNDRFWPKAACGLVIHATAGNDPKRTLVQLRVISSLGRSAQRHSCALTVEMSISGFAAIMPSAVSSG